MNIRKTSLIVAFMAVMVFAGPASAQDKSSWGVQVSVTPSWETFPALESRAFGASSEPWDAENLIEPGSKIFLRRLIGDWLGAGTDVSGSDLTVGVVRGNINGGEWGVSYVRRNIDDSSRIENMGLECFGPSGDFCVAKGRTYELHSVSMNGAEVYKFIPLFRVNRIQIGAMLAGGVARMGGSATKRALAPSITSQTLTQFAVNAGYTVQEVSAADMLANLDVSSIFPLARAEVTVAVRVTQHLRVKAGGGFNHPGIAKISVGTTYLF